MKKKKWCTIILVLLNFISFCYENNIVFFFFSLLLLVKLSLLGLFISILISFLCFFSWLLFLYNYCSSNYSNNFRSYGTSFALSPFRDGKNDNNMESNTEKLIFINVHTYKTTQKWGKEIKGNNFFYCKVGRAITCIQGEKVLLFMPT